MLQVQTENLYDLPNGWKWTSLEKISINHDGKRIPVKRSDREIVQGHYPYYGASGIIDHVDKYLFDGNYLLLAEDGANLLSRSTPIAFQASDKFWVNNHAHVLTTAEGIPLGYLEHYLNGLDLALHVTGTAQPKLTKQNMDRIPVPLAPLPEQQRIVAAIETHFTRLDTAVATLHRLQANLKRYRAAVLKAACEGRLVGQDPTDEPATQLLARILAERRSKWQAANPGKKYQEPTPPDTYNLLDLPDGWTWTTIEQLAAHQPRAITDGPFGSNLKTSHYTNSGPRVIRLQNIGNGYFIDEKAHVSEEHFKLLINHQICAGDLVIAALGTDLPRACIIPDYVGSAIVKADCIRFKPHADLANTTYLQAALNSQPLKTFANQIIHGVGRPRLNQQEIKSLPIPIPPLNEQVLIAAEVERRLSVIDQHEKAIRANLARAARLRQSILKRAFTGRLVPQDPADEPASLLLERIKAARTNKTKPQQLKLGDV